MSTTRWRKKLWRLRCWYKRNFYDSSGIPNNPWVLMFMTTSAGFYYYALPVADAYIVFEGLTLAIPWWLCVYHPRNVPLLGADASDKRTRKRERISTRRDEIRRNLRFFPKTVIRSVNNFFSPELVRETWIKMLKACYRCWFTMISRDKKVRACTSRACTFVGRASAH